MTTIAPINVVFNMEISAYLHRNSSIQ